MKMVEAHAYPYRYLHCFLTQDQWNHSHEYRDSPHNRPWVIIIANPFSSWCGLFATIFLGHPHLIPYSRDRIIYEWYESESIWIESNLSRLQSTNPPGVVQSFQDCFRFLKEAAHFHPSIERAIKVFKTGSIGGSWSPIFVTPRRYPQWQRTFIRFFIHLKRTKALGGRPLPRDRSFFSIRKVPSLISSNRNQSLEIPARHAER